MGSVSGHIILKHLVQKTDRRASENATTNATQRAMGVAAIDSGKGGSSQTVGDLVWPKSSAFTAQYRVAFLCNSVNKGNDGASNFRLALITTISAALRANY
ncbi:uncharacterized protein LOC143211950 [Lasioglossum baleicum]|uniref:uncharacterized protein LOC143211950 n=1 Tax=Lasioglossum baleicum TaxID=434251 RepID=UPI003FCE8983